MFWRTTAQWMISESGNKAIAPELVRLVQNSEFAVPHALEALAALKELKPELVVASLDSRQATACRAAIRLATPDQLKTAFITNGTIKASGRELAEILVGLSGGASDPAIGAAIYQVAADSQSNIFDDNILRDAWQIAVRKQAAGVLAAAKGSDNGESSNPETVNILPNADFSEVANGLPVSWTDLRTYGGARGEAIKVSAPAEGRDGSTCLKVSCDQNTDSGVAISLPLKAGTRYRLSGWIKTENLKPVGNSPGALLNIHSGQKTSGVKDTTDWTQVSLEFDSGGEREALIHCLFGGYGGAKGTAWFDDLSLIAIGSRDSLSGALKTLAAFHDAGGPTTPKEIVRKFKPDPEVHERGEAVYAKTCIACHGTDAKGVPHAFPPIDGSDWLTGDPALPIKIVLHGLIGPVKVGDEEFNSVTAPLVPSLNDQEIADVLTYVRQRWTNDAAPVDEATVIMIRAQTKGRTEMWNAGELGH